MRIAFYAPMKPPTAPRPSGDRRMARSLIAAMEQAGHQVTLASNFRSRDGAGDPHRQQRLQQLGRRLGERIVRRYSASGNEPRPDLWFTYHVYYKAPDWLGPFVSRALDIPYVIAEASFAPKRAGGPWAIGHEAAATAIRSADRIVDINGANAPCVIPLLDDPSRLMPLKPFLDTKPFAAAQSPAIAIDGRFSLITIAMMRTGDKLDSYRALAGALGKLNSQAWQLSIVGDGPARPEIEELMAPLGRDRVRFLGQRSAEDMPALLAGADIFIWPAIKEAYGMAILEAQAAGVPVVAGDAGGVSEIVAHEKTGLLVPEGDMGALAAALDTLLDNPEGRHRMACAALKKTADEHSIETAALRLNDILTSARQRRAA
jgi:glycosyltransferase involved in cell wall biosynthesis